MKETLSSVKNFTVLSIATVLTPLQFGVGLVDDGVHPLSQIVMGSTYTALKALKVLSIKLIIYSHYIHTGDG